jgi:hypothetical protein
MKGLLSLVLAAVAMTAAPIVVNVERSDERLQIRLELAEPLPEELEIALSKGGRTEVQYLLRVYSPRRLLPDRRTWRGTADSIVSFDAITGRYRCQLIVNGTTTTSMETNSAAEARSWLAAPPTIEVPLPRGRRGSILRVRTRAVFARGTTWLVFPTSDGTRWVEVLLEPLETDQ